ncbi:MAG: hypothetical protein ABS76_29490 [Pelagibacterium sp. SCN 64-44]|nr:MAG: hypothetical protein ABS76_29490 [Pelagibacterium sp. SCN 64-44]
MTDRQALAGCRFAVATAAPGSAAPILALHKTGSTPEETIALVQRIAPQRAVLAPEGDVLEGGRRRFFARHADGSFDVADLIGRAAALVGFVEALPEEAETGPILFGISHGANIGAAMLLSRPDLFSGALFIRLAGLPDALPSNALGGLEMLLISGDADQTVPQADSKHAAERMARLGARVEHRTVAAAHAVVPEDIDIARDWIARIMGVHPGQTSHWRH